MKAPEFVSLVGMDGSLNVIGATIVVPLRMLGELAQSHGTEIVVFLEERPDDVSIEVPGVRFEVDSKP